MGIDESQGFNPEPYISLRPTIHFVRGAATANAIKPLHLPLRILVLASSPSDRPPLKIRDEVDLLLRCWGDLAREEKVHVDFVQGSDTLARTMQLLEHGRYHILHFIGHGEQVGGEVRLLLEDADGKACPKSGMELWQEFSHPGAPHLVVLNLCKGATAASEPAFSSLAEVFLEAGVPGVVAHQFEISDGAAAAFAHAFYLRILNGAPVDYALARARAALASSREWHTPVLFLTSTTGQLFLSPIGDPLALPPLAAVPIQKAREAASTKRWPEAASYARLALFHKPDDPPARDLLAMALAEEELDVCLQEARSALAQHDWAGAAVWYERYLEKDAAHHRSQSERASAALLKNAALAGVGVRDPLLKLNDQSTLEGSFPYDCLIKFGIHPSLPAKVVQDILLPLDRAENVAWRALRNLEQRLEVDFFLYQAHSWEKLLEFLEKVADWRIQPTEAEISALKEDAPIVLLLMNQRKAARQHLEKLQCPGPLAALAWHRLALLSFAEAQHQEQSGGHASAKQAWRQSIAYWVGTLAADAYWGTWCAERQSCYGHRAVDTLEAAQRAAVRQRLAGRLAAEVLLHCSACRTAFEIEWQAAQALRAVGGLKLKNQTWVGGPILLRLLGLEHEFSAFVAAAQRELDRHRRLSLAEALRKAPQVSEEALSRLRRYFSTLGFPAALLNLGRPEDALKALPTPSQEDEFNSENPAYAYLHDKRHIYASDSSTLAFEACLDLSQTLIACSPPNPDAAAKAWMEALKHGREANLETEVARQIAELALGRANALRSRVEHSAGELDSLNEAICVLEAAQAMLPDELCDDVTCALAEHLNMRGVRYEYDNLHDNAYADLSRAFNLYPGNVAIVNDLCVTLVYWALDCDRELAKQRLCKARCLAEAGLRLQEDSQLEKTLEWINEELEILAHGAELGQKAWEQLSRVLAEPDRASAPGHDEVGSRVARAEEKRQSGSYREAIAELKAALNSAPNNAWVRQDLTQTYYDWADSELKSGHIRETGEILAAAESCGLERSLFQRIRRQLEIALAIEGGE